MATPGPTDVHVDTEDLRTYSNQVYDEAKVFSGSALGAANFGAATDQATTHADISGSQFVGNPNSDSGMGASMDFWKTHTNRVTELSEFSGDLSQSLEAITAASGAIATAYDSSDEVNADRIRDQSGFFRQPWDTGAGTLDELRRTPPPAN